MLQVMHICLLYMIAISQHLWDGSASNFISKMLYYTKLYLAKVAAMLRFFAVKFIIVSQFSLYRIASKYIFEIITLNILVQFRICLTSNFEIINESDFK